MNRSGGCALGAASAFLADGRDSRDGTVGGDFVKRARSLTANRGNFAAFKLREGHRQLPISAPGPAGFVSRFDALIAIIDYSGSCSLGRVLVDGHEVGHDLRTLPLATLQGCQEEKLARQRNRQGVRQRQRHCNRPLLGDDPACQAPGPGAVQASRHRSRCGHFYYTRFRKFCRSAASDTATRARISVRRSLCNLGLSRLHMVGRAWRLGGSPPQPSRDGPSGHGPNLAGATASFGSPDGGWDARAASNGANCPISAS